MQSRRFQLYRKRALERGVSRDILYSIQDSMSLIEDKNSELRTVLTLRHLAYQCDVPFRYLRGVVSRTQPNLYRSFRIQKSNQGKRNVAYRVISVPDTKLKIVQKWINANILAYLSVDPSSVAYSTGDSIKAAAENHCGARWMIKTDIQNFFESVSESQVYRVFNRVGYQPLISFEMARICTRTRASRTMVDSRWNVIPYK